MSELLRRIGERIKGVVTERAELPEHREDKVLHGLRRHAQLYRDEDEKTALRRYIQARQQQEARSTFNPGGSILNAGNRLKTRPKPKGMLGKDKTYLCKGRF